MSYIFSEEPIKVPRFEESAGFYTTPERSAMMKKIRATNTKAEIALRKALWGFGLRYRIHDKRIPGRPDMAFTRWKVAVFVDGDYWHGYDWAEKQHKIKKNRDFWIPKIERNMQRDREVNALLTQMGWHVLRIWEHEIKSDFGASVFRVLAFVQEKAGVKLGDVLFEN